MPVSKSQKKEVIDGLKTALSQAKSTVFVNFHKLTVADSTAMRKELSKNKITYTVAKKTLIKKALEDAKVSGSLPALDGEIAIAYASDLTAPAREIFAFQKKLKDKLTIVGGVFESKFMSKEEMMAIALIPSVSTLHGMFANVINSPIQRFVVALGEIAKTKPTA
ncbi:MAG: ribosomal protein large subunit ribosomal protein [Candidatus Parcubacteria bacterium]|jgi:large subunit ribosomal protein L10